MIHNQRIQPAPPRMRKLNGFFRNGRVRHVAGKDFDLFRAVLVVKLVEGGVGAGYEDCFVGVGEEVVGGCEADSWGKGVRW